MPDSQADQALASARQAADPIVACQALLTRWPGHVASLDALGGLAFEARNYALAIESWQRLLSLSPTARTWNNLGSAQLAARQTSAAQISFEQALTLDARLWTANYQLAGILLARQAWHEALPHAQIALPQVAKLAARLYKAALEIARGGELDLADRYLALCCAHPAQAGVPEHEIYASRAGCLLYADEQAARACYERANLLAAQLAAQSSEAGKAEAGKAESGPASQAHAGSLRGQGLNTSSLAYAWPHLMALPYIYDSHAHLDATRANFGAELEGFAASLDRRFASADFLQILSTLRPPFLLAYQGQDDRPLMERIGGIWTDYLVRHGAQLRCQRSPGGRPRLRVGFASRFFYTHSVMLAFGELIAELASEDDFEVICIQLDPHRDAYSESLEAKVARFVRFEGPVSARTVYELELDVLIFPDIGMDHLSYQLALHRLAPIQCLLPGHPVTSGLPEIDYYLSASLSEPAGAQAHYSETLVPAPARLFRFAPVSPPARPLTRAELGLPDNRRLYYCPMTLFKLHPDFDAMLGGILAADPQALVLLPQYRNTRLHLRLKARLERALGPLADRIRFMPWLDRDGLASLILLSDAVLDSYCFSGGTTSQMVLALGQPCVTLAAPFLRGRITSGLYRRIGLPELISDSPQAYVDQAVRLAIDTDYRAELQARLRERRETLSVVPDDAFRLSGFLRNAVAAWPARVEGINSASATS